MRRTAVLLACAALITAGCTASEPGSTPATGLGTTTVSAPSSTLPPPTATSTEPSTTTPPQARWISLEGGTLFDRRTGEPFVPRGVNLLRKQPLAGDILFGGYDPAWVDEQLDSIADLGFNTVRFFLDLCMSCTATDEGLRPIFLDNLTDLLRRMADRGLVALPTSNDVPDPGYSNRLPCCEPFGGYRNSLYLSAEGHDIAVEYFTDVITGLQERDAPLHAVMGWQLANEQWFLRDVPPVSLTEGTITAADGERYDLGDDAQVTAMLENNLVRYISTVRRAIRRLDEGSLVTIGLFSAEEPEAGRVARDNRWVLADAVIRRSDVDFVDLHAYPGLGGTWDLIGTAFGIDEPAPTPLLLGEFGPFSSAYADATEAAAAMARWQAQSCEYGFAGWLVWLWGEQRDDEVITANFGEADVARALSPATRPDPCDAAPYASANLALDRPVRASAEESAEYAGRWVTDGSAGTWWSAAEGPPQWVEIDLETPATVERVEILIGFVSPPGPQTHRVYVRGEEEPGIGRLVGEISTDAAQGDVLVVTLDPAADGVRYVRVETVEMEGWVILHEVSVFGSR